MEETTNPQLGQRDPIVALARSFKFDCDCLWDDSIKSLYRFKELDSYYRQQFEEGLGKLIQASDIFDEIIAEVKEWD